MRPCVADQLTSGQAFVAAKVIGDDDIAGRQCWGEALADPGGEGIPVDRPVQNEGCHDVVVTHSGQECQGFPVPVRDMGCQSLAPRGPAASPGHVGLDPGFIDEDQSLGIKPMLMRPPARPAPRHLRAHLLTGHQRFF